MKNQVKPFWFTEHKTSYVNGFSPCLESLHPFCSVASSWIHSVNAFVRCPLNRHKHARTHARKHARTNTHAHTIIHLCPLVHSDTLHSSRWWRDGVNALCSLREYTTVLCPQEVWQSVRKHVNEARSPGTLASSIWSPIGDNCSYHPGPCNCLVTYRR